MANRIAAREDALEAQPAGLSLVIVATTGDGTCNALLSARKLAAGRPARVVLIAPHLTSFADAPVPAEAEQAAVDSYRTLAGKAGVAATIVSCVCRRYDDIRSLLDPSSVVIVGGRRHLLWPTREQRFADRLSADGFAVVFAQPPASTEELAWAF